MIKNDKDSSRSHVPGGLTFTQRNSLMSGRKTISSLSHTCLPLISILPRSFHRCRPYLMKIWTKTHTDTHRISQSSCFMFACVHFVFISRLDFHLHTIWIIRKDQHTDFLLTHLILVTSTQSSKSSQTWKTKRRGSKSMSLNSFYPKRKLLVVLTLNALVHKSEWVKNIPTIIPFKSCVQIFNVISPNCFRSLTQNDLIN